MLTVFAMVNPCLPALLAALVAAPAPPAGSPARLSGEELELLRGTLRPEGLAELESHSAPLAALPLSEVEATLDLERARVDGHLRLVFTNRESAPLAELVLRLPPHAPAPRPAATAGVEAITVDGRAARAHARGSLLEVTLPEPLAPMATLALALDFHAVLSRLPLGDDALASPQELLAQLAPALGALAPPPRTNTAARGGEAAGADLAGTCAVSRAGAVLLDWYPILAARVGGAWDKSESRLPGAPLRAEVGSAIVALAAPRGMHVLGAGVLLGQHEQGAGEVAAFALAGLRGALGLAVLHEVDEARDELRPEGDPQRPPVRLRVASLHGPHGARALLSCARAALAELAMRWGPYPWSDFVAVEVPLAAGESGVARSGAAFIARGLGGGVESPWLGGADDPRDASDPLPQGQSLFSFSCQHQVAHQWFPGVVGSDPRGAPWLDEALAQDGAVRVAAAAAGGGDEGRAAAELATRRYVALNFQGMRALGFPDGRADARADELRAPSVYAGLVEGKAPLYLARVRALIGDGQFDAALRALRGQRGFREGGTAELLAAFDKIDPARTPQLDALAQRWLRESHGDEDIAPLDAADLLDGLGGSAATGAQLAPLLRLLQAPGAVPPGQPRADDAALRRVLRDLERAVPELHDLMKQARRGP